MALLTRAPRLRQRTSRTGRGSYEKSSILHPETLTLDELVRELTIDSVEFEERDRVQRAVRDLTAGGLIHRVGDLVLPTRAAAIFHELSDD